MGCASSSDQDAVDQPAPGPVRHISGRPTRAITGPPAWKANRPISDDELDRMRREFWETRVEGSPQTWAALRVVADTILAGDFEQANALLEVGWPPTDSGLPNRSGRSLGMTAPALLPPLFSGFKHHDTQWDHGGVLRWAGARVQRAPLLPRPAVEPAGAFARQTAPAVDQTSKGDAVQGGCRIQVPPCGGAGALPSSADALARRPRPGAHPRPRPPQFPDIELKHELETPISKVKQRFVEEAGEKAPPVDKIRFFFMGRECKDGDLLQTCGVSDGVVITVCAMQ